MTYTKEERRERARDANRRYKERHPERAKQHASEYRKRLIERLGAEEVRRRDNAKAERARRKRGVTPRVAQPKRCTHLQRNYGITMEDERRMFEEQGGTCDICGKVKGYRLHVDHCHTTGKVRGLLCVSCNTTIGKEENSPGLFARMLDYLRENQ